MEFKKCDDKGDRHIDVLLPQFSVALMSDEARYQWTHGITPHSADIAREMDPSHASGRLTLIKRGVRTSLTFRNVQHSAICHCSMYFQCPVDVSYCYYATAHPIVGTGGIVFLECLSICAHVCLRRRVCACLPEWRHFSTDGF